MTPSWWQFTLLALAAYRLTRLAGWDDFPPIQKLRWRLIGEMVVPNTAEERETGVMPVVYTRPLLAHFIHCPFCVGFWLSVLVVAAWWISPHAVLLASVPFALSAVVGLVAKNLDP